jgi:hypothetical protein
VNATWGLAYSLTLYITNRQAVDVEDFTVVMDLMKDFGFMGTKSLRIVCEITGSKYQRLSTISRVKSKSGPQEQYDRELLVL